MNMVRKIIESTYDGRCTVTQRAECEKPNGSTGFTNTVILENEPCRLLLIVRNLPRKEIELQFKRKL